MDNTQTINNIYNITKQISEEVLQISSAYNVSYGWNKLEVFVLNTEDNHVNNTLKYLFQYILFAIFTVSQLATILWPAVVILMCILLILILMGRPLWLAFIGLRKILMNVKAIQTFVQNTYITDFFAFIHTLLCIKYWLHIVSFILYRSNNIDSSYEGMHVVRAANVLNCLSRIMRVKRYLLCNSYGEHIRFVYINTSTYTEVCILHRPEVDFMQKTFKSHTRAAFLLLLNFVVMSSAIYSSGRMVTFWGVTIKFMCSIGSIIFVYSYGKTYAKRSKYIGSLYLMITWELMEQGNIYLQMRDQWRHKVVSFRSKQVVPYMNIQPLSPQMVENILEEIERIHERKLLVQNLKLERLIQQCTETLSLSKYGNNKSGKSNNEISRNVQQKNFLLSLAKESWSYSMIVQKKATDAYNNATVAFIVSIILTTIIVLLPHNNAVAVDVIMGAILGILTTALIKMFNGTKEFSNSVTIYREASLMLARANSQPNPEATAGLSNITKIEYLELTKMSLHNLNIGNDNITNNEQLKECTPEWCTEITEYRPTHEYPHIFYLEKTTHDEEYDDIEQCYKKIDDEREIEDANDIKIVGNEVNIYNFIDILKIQQSDIQKHFCNNSHIRLKKLKPPVP